MDRSERGARSTRDRIRGSTNAEMNDVGGLSFGSEGHGKGREIVGSIESAVVNGIRPF